VRFEQSVSDERHEQRTKCVDHVFVCFFSYNVSPSQQIII
jgi:hypothetical protein